MFLNSLKRSNKSKPWGTGEAWNNTEVAESHHISLDWEMEADNSD